MFIVNAARLGGDVCSTGGLRGQGTSRSQSGPQYTYEGPSLQNNRAANPD